MPITGTMLPTHKFKTNISDPRNDFYTLLQNLNKNGQKRTNKFWIQKLELIARDLGQQHTP